LREIVTMRDRPAAVGGVIGLVSFCAYGFVSGHHLQTTAAVLGVIAGIAAAAGSAPAIRHHRLARALRRISEPTTLTGVRARTGALRGSALVAGLVRPTIYCDRRLPELLSERQLHAVMLHEQAHQRARDPVRLLLVELVAPVARRSASGRQWIEWTAARREIAADRHALANGATRQDLAAALLKLPRVAAATAPAFTSAADLRLRALLEDPLVSPVRPIFVRTARAVGGGVAGAAACTWFVHWLFAGVGVVCC
jgi:hypothetical protein